MQFKIFLEALNTLGTNTAGNAPGNALGLAGNPSLLIGGIILILAAVAIFWFLKKIVFHLISGFIGWVIVLFVLKVNLPLVPSLVISLIFGLAGLGAMLLMKFFGLL